MGPRLETVPSVGPVIASAFRARVTDPKLFKNGRHMSAWIGIVPENDSTGGKVKQKGLSKKGDRYLRSLIVNGAMAVVRQAQGRPDKHPWVAKLLGRMSAKPIMAHGSRLRESKRRLRPWAGLSVPCGLEFCTP